MSKEQLAIVNQDTIKILTLNDEEMPPKSDDSFLPNSSQKAEKGD